MEFNMKTHHKTIVPRNPYVQAAHQRKAGAHDKKTKVKRRDARQALRQALRQTEQGGDFPPFLRSIPLQHDHSEHI